MNKSYTSEENQVIEQFTEDEIEEIEDRIDSEIARKISKEYEEHPENFISEDEMFKRLDRIRTVKN